MVLSATTVFLFLLVSLLTKADSQIVLTAQPQTVDLTNPQPLTVNCSYEIEGNSMLTPPVSMFMQHSTTGNQTFVQVASINVFTGVRSMSGEGRVEGTLDQDGGHLQVTWDRPTWSHSGSYSCLVVSIHSKSGLPWQDGTTVDVEANPQDVDTLSRMFARLQDENIILNERIMHLLEDLTTCIEDKSTENPGDLIPLKVPQAGPTADGQPCDASGDVPAEVPGEGPQVDGENDTSVSGTEDIEGEHNPIEGPGDDKKIEETIADDLFHIIVTSDFHKYYVSKERYKNLTDSETSCRKFDLNLVAFEGDGATEFTELTSRLEELQGMNRDMKGFLTGAQEFENQWFYAFYQNGTEDFEQVHYTKWFGNEPDQAETNKCMTISKKRGSWSMRDFPCVNKFSTRSNRGQYYPIYYICE